MVGGPREDLQSDSLIIPIGGESALEAEDSRGEERRTDDCFNDLHV